jgi:hypothetical protein
MTDDDIEYSDIPPLDDELFNQATLVKPTAKPKPINHKQDTEILQS